MSLLVKDFLKDKRVPGFLQESSLQELHKISKVFPSIGLANCKKDIELDYDDKYTLDVVSNLQNQLADQIDHETYQYHLCEAIRSKAARSVENGKWALKLPRDVKVPYCFGSIEPLLFKKGQSIFKVYNRFCQSYEDLPKLETLSSFKAFSSANIGGETKLQVVFSSDGMDGAWDLLTMSERGISTCQSWSGGEFPDSLAGSIADPFAGIIYLTNGKKCSNFGSRMIRRCIVRYVFDSKNGKPFLFIDRMYPKYEARILSEFEKLLKEKTNGEFVIQTYDKGTKPDLGSCFIRLTENVRHLCQSERSYMDTAFEYLKPTVEDIQAILKHKFTRLVNRCSHIVFDKQPITQGKYTGKLARIIKPDLKFILNTYYRDLAHLVVDDMRPIADTNQYYNSLIYHYILNKKHLEDERSQQLARHINSYFKLNKVNALKKSDLTPLLTDCDKLICGALKQELKQRLAQKLPKTQNLAATNE